jgi:hypothetical protein
MLAATYQNAGELQRLLEHKQTQGQGQGVVKGH